MWLDQVFIGVRDNDSRGRLSAVHPRQQHPGEIEGRNMLEKQARELKRLTAFFGILEPAADIGGANPVGVRRDQLAISGAALEDAGERDRLRVTWR